MVPEVRLERLTEKRSTASIREQYLKVGEPRVRLEVKETVPTGQGMGDGRSMPGGW
jgi:hypothetical protein